MTELLAITREYVMGPTDPVAMGRAALKCLSKVDETCARAEWDAAEEHCRVGARVTELVPPYRGQIQPLLAWAIVQFHQGLVMFGKDDVDGSLKQLALAADELAPVTPLQAAAIRLCRALIARESGQRDEFLWDLQRSWNLLGDVHNDKAERLRARLNGEFESLI